jgi:hypothetical protein
MLEDIGVFGTAETFDLIFNEILWIN